MDLLCPVCDSEIFENESERNKYLATLRKRNDKSIYNKYTINNINLDEFEKVLNDYITIYNIDFDIYFVNCEFKLEFDKNFILNKETNCIHNLESEKISIILSYHIKYHESKGYKFCCINQMNILILLDKCNITYKKYFNSPMLMVERRINCIIAKNTQLIISLDRNKNHPLMRKYSYISFML